MWPSVVICVTIKSYRSLAGNIFVAILFGFQIPPKIHSESLNTQINKVFHILQIFSVCIQETKDI